MTRCTVSLMGSTLSFGKFFTSRGPRFKIVFKSKALLQAEADKEKWQKKACRYDQELRLLESMLRALDPSFSKTYKPLPRPYAR